MEANDLDEKEKVYLELLKTVPPLHKINFHICSVIPYISALDAHIKKKVLHEGFIFVDDQKVYVEEDGKKDFVVQGFGFEDENGEEKIEIERIHEDYYKVILYRLILAEFRSTNIYKRNVGLDGKAEKIARLDLGLSNDEKNCIKSANSPTVEKMHKFQITELRHAETKSLPQDFETHDNFIRRFIQSNNFSDMEQKQWKTLRLMTNYKKIIEHLIQFAIKVFDQLNNHIFHKIKLNPSYNISLNFPVDKTKVVDFVLNMPKSSIIIGLHFCKCPPQIKIAKLHLQKASVLYNGALHVKNCCAQLIGENPGEYQDKEIDMFLLIASKCFVKYKTARAYLQCGTTLCKL